jgi:translation initiation factor 3 subunit C
MSRFFRQAGNSDSESASSDSDSELLSSDGNEGLSKVQATIAKPAMSRFLRTAGSSSGSESESESDDDEPEDGDASSGEDHPVRILSAVDKRLKEMQATGKVIDNALKINDWMAISNGTSHSPLSLSNPCILLNTRCE